MFGVRPLARDRRGVTIIEFAIVAPVMVMLMMGLGDTLFQMYVRSVLQGAVQKAGRDSGIEGGGSNTSSIDAKVVAIVGNVVPKLSSNCSAPSGSATWCSTRKNYDDFADVAPEPFTDSNGNGIHDATECFTDINGNGVWDADPGASGQGGANDVTLYTFTISYPHMFPVAKMLGWTSNATATATTLLKNQPWDSQQTTASATICP
jgi:Flp pilus assembly pilin Flp